MKTRIYNMIGVLLAMCAVSCQKSEVNTSESDVDENYITCDISDIETKTHLDDQKYVVWDTDDEILVKGSNGTAIYKLVTGAGTKRGTFQKVSGVDLTGTSFEAYSPASAYDGTNIVWPETQQYMSDGVVSGAPMKAEATSLKEVLHFKNIGGLVRLTLKTQEGTKNVSFIKIKTEDKDIVLNCPSSGIPVGTSGTDFYLALPAKTSYSKFVIEATATDGGACQRIATKAITVGRSEITTLIFTAKKWLYLVSVSPTDKVIFAPGNLWCYIDWNVSKAVFVFENSQTDYRQRNGYTYDSAVINGVKTTTPEGTSGLFQWAGSCNTTNPIAALTHGALSELDTDKGELVGTGSDFINFGDGYDDGKTWRSLTKDEWDYMVNVRKVGGATGYGNTCMWYTFGYTQGLLIFPDGYTGPKSGLSDIPENAIFLPDAGYAKINSKIIPNGERGCYWTSTACSETNPGYTAYGVNLGKFNISFPIEIAARYRDRGYSMRLVSDKWDAI